MDTIHPKGRLTRNAAAICAVPIPETVRSVSATCEARLSEGWQQAAEAGGRRLRRRATRHGGRSRERVGRLGDGDGLLARGSGAVRPRSVDQAARGNADQPRSRILRQAVGLPLPDRRLQRLLGSVLAVAASRCSSGSAWNAATKSPVGCPQGCGLE
jgi:hypothetical protein